MDWYRVILAFAVILAGCGSVVDGGRGPEVGAPTPKLTPAPVPEVTATPVSLPPGITTDRITNPDKLLAAHRMALEGQSYTLRVRVRIDGVLSQRLFRVETPQRYVQYDQLSEPRSNTTNFADGETLYRRAEYSNKTVYGRIEGVTPPSPVAVSLSRAFLQVDGVEVFETTVDGEPAFVVRGTYPVHRRMSSFRNFTVRAVVEPDGFIRSLHMSYVRTNGPTRKNVTRSFAYSNVNSTTVERPDWVSERWNRTAVPG